MIINSIWLGVLAALALTAAPLTAQDDDPRALARRIVATTSLAAKEYAEGVVDGRVVAEEEVDEARLFLSEAGQAAASLPPAFTDIRETLTGLQALVDELAEPDDVASLAEALVARLEEAFGGLGGGPSGLRPDFAAAGIVYERRCGSCHGPAGGADGPAAAALDPPPADLTSIAGMFDQTPLDSYRKIAIGVSGTSMPGFESELTERQIWALAWYVHSLRADDDARARGASIVGVHCPACTGGALPALAVLPAELADPAIHAERSDEQLIGGLVVSGLLAGSVDSASASDIVAYARGLPFAEPAGDGKTEPLARTRTELARAVREARDGQPDVAARHAFDSYVQFESVETELALRDRALATRLEGLFATFRARTQSPGDGALMTEAFTTLDRALRDAEAILDEQQSMAGLFTQSFILLLREGIEAILIVGALATLLVRAGVPQRRREIWIGVALALGASFLTAVALETVFRLSVAQQEALEGVTMLVATVVLFGVSYWLVSKIEVRHWNAFVKRQVDSALSKGSAFALALTAFLAVYREGFETVLFYKALFISAEGQGATPIGFGGLVAAIALAVVYVSIARFGLRIPLRPFFAITSAVLIYMAVSFAGKGIAELQESNLIPATLIEWAPSVPWLGLYPTLQSVALQAVLLTLVAAGILWTFVLQPRTAGARGD